STPSSCAPCSCRRWRWTWAGPSGGPRGWRAWRSERGGWRPPPLCGWHPRPFRAQATSALPRPAPLALPCLAPPPLPRLGPAAFPRQPDHVPVALAAAGAHALHLDLEPRPGEALRERLAGERRPHAQRPAGPQGAVQRAQAGGRVEPLVALLPGALRPVVGVEEDHRSEEHTSE